MEEWRDIKGYEGIYQVSSYGRVRSLDGAFMTRGKSGFCKPKPGIELKQSNYKGYKYVFLYNGDSKSRKGVHQLVAMMFCDGYVEGHEVNHIDENPSNNHADNLEWVSHYDNMKHGTLAERMGRSHWHPVVVCKDGVEMTFDSMRQASEVLNLDYRAICKVARGRHAHHHGYTFRYIS